MNEPPLATGKSPEKQYEFRELNHSEDELREACALFERAFGERSIDPDFLRWEYLQNPLGRAVGYNAYHDDALAAHYVTLPINSRVFGREAKGLLSINTATDPAHQGQGLFSRLAEMTFAKGRELGYEYVVGVANQNSVHGFVKRLWFQRVGLLETRLVTRIQRKADGPPLDYTRVWDKDTLAWRLNNPRKTYYARRQGGVASLFGRTARFQAIVGQVDEGLLPERIAAPPVSLNPLRVWIGIDPQVDWRKHLSIPVPQRFKKVPLTLIYRDLAGLRTLNPAAVRYWAMDFDAY